MGLAQHAVVVGDEDRAVTIGTRVIFAALRPERAAGALLGHKAETEAIPVALAVNPRRRLAIGAGTGLLVGTDAERRDRKAVRVGAATLGDRRDEVGFTVAQGGNLGARFALARRGVHFNETPQCMNYHYAVCLQCRNRLQYR